MFNQLQEDWYLIHKYGRYGCFSKNMDTKLDSDKTFKKIRYNGEDRTIYRRGSLMKQLAKIWNDFMKEACLQHILG